MKRAGFILADQIISATIITIALSFFALNYHALAKQKRTMGEHLIAARLIKEAADDPTCHHFYRNGMEVKRTAQRITVYMHGQMVEQLWQK